LLWRSSGFGIAPADCQSAKQQAASLRYETASARFSAKSLKVF
jgi:hypothetical protein